MQVDSNMSAIEFELWMSIVTHSPNASSQEHVSNLIWAQNVHGDSQAGCMFTGGCQQLNLSSECPWWLTPWMQDYRSMLAIEFKLRMSMVTHKLDASSQQYICQQLNLSSECPWWLTIWMQVYSSMSAIKFELWMSMVTHSLDACSQEHVSN